MTTAVETLLLSADVCAGARVAIKSARSSVSTRRFRALYPFRFRRLLGIGSPNYVVAKSLRVNALKNKLLQITARRQRDQNEQNDISQLNLTESFITLRQRQND